MCDVRVFVGTTPLDKSLRRPFSIVHTLTFTWAVSAAGSDSLCSSSSSFMPDGVAPAPATPRQCVSGIRKGFMYVLLSPSSVC